MGVLCDGPAVLLDALLHCTVGHREHTINKVGEAFVFDVTLCVLGGRFRVSRQSSLLESESRIRAPRLSTVRPTSLGGCAIRKRPTQTRTRFEVSGNASRLVRC